MVLEKDLIRKAYKKKIRKTFWEIGEDYFLEGKIIGIVIIGLKKSRRGVREIAS